jgi:DNA-binding NtrC family response regulator
MQESSSTEPPAKVAVLSVNLFPEDEATLSNIFQRCRWPLYQARSWPEAHAILDEHKIPVIIGEADPGGTWKKLLKRRSEDSHSPQLIVASHFADDRLWAEALNLGAYDVLAEPFHAAEVFRTVSLAWRQWREGSRHNCLVTAS